MGNEKKSVKASGSVKRQRKLRFLRTRARELKMIGKALISTKHPVLVHIIPMRRCNLDCGYCNEYDQVSKPVPIEEMKRRLDYLAAMGTSIITISGGEPLMHPELEEVIRHIRKRGMIAGMITNGFLLSKERIASLNAAGLEHLQISIDNVIPDEVSKKSLKTLDSRLEWLAQYAIFQVNINSVLGSGVKNPEDALPVRFKVSVHLRGWAGALVLAAARLSSYSAFEIHAGNAPAGIFDRQILRSALHGILRAADRDIGQLARSAEFETDADVAPGGPGADWEVKIRMVVK